MRWYHNLFMGEKARKKKYKIIWKIKHNAGLVNIYVITTATNPQNLLDIYPSWVLMQPYFRELDTQIIGIACGYEEAITVVQNIIETMYSETGGFDIRNFMTK